MAYINVAEWSSDQVCDWLKGLDDSMYNYSYAFVKNEVGGRQLLNIRPYVLEQLGMHCIGHQEIVLEAVENLRNFHFNLDKENLQFMALHVATAARSLHGQLASQCGASVIETQILSDITRTIATIKPLISWLERAPFRGQFQFTEICRKMLRLGLEMATIAQRERFVENPVEKIRSTAKTLELLANYIIQDITDPMLLQPASLNLVTLKKRESELGFNIESTYHGIHRITDIKHNSPAHNSGKIEDGDEIVQINYQTVVGWQYKSVLLQLRESLPDVLLTLKKRPKHTKIYGQIYMQPYRLPSKKRSVGNRWGENVPSPRPNLLTKSENNFKTAPLTLSAGENEKTDDGDTDSISSDILTPTDSKATEKESRLYYPKPRAMLQRRNTICGDELFGHKRLSGISPLWHERKSGTVCDPASPSLRDKSVSFGFGLEITSRPTTCIGISSGTVDTDGSGTSGGGGVVKLHNSTNFIIPTMEDHILQPLEELQEPFKAGVSKVVRFDSNMKVVDYPLDEKYTCNVENTILETFEPIPFADEEDDIQQSLVVDTHKSLPNNIQNAQECGGALNKNHDDNRNSDALLETVNVSALARRGRFDKSHSTPTYDNSGEESNTPPPAVEPRKEYLLVTPPVPPPRPKKQIEQNSAVTPIPVPPKPPGLMASMTVTTTTTTAITTAPNLSTATPSSCIITTFSTATTTPTPSQPPATTVKSPATNEKTSPNMHPIENHINDIRDLHTPLKIRNLTLKKKHNLIIKRRNVNLKLLGTGDIQGHLYRRTKDKRGVTFWARLYFLMLDTLLYGFRSKESAKASCVIFLPGFTVSLAKEVHSKPYAFKVYHAAKTFYFAAESQDALNQWIDLIRQATNSTNRMATTLNASPGLTNSDINTKDLFSENESSGEESINDSFINKNLCTPSPQANYKENDSDAHSNAITIVPITTTQTPITTPNSTRHDKRYLGSLRKFTKGTLHFKSSSSTNEKKFSSNDIPVPTEQFRSYRKVPGGSYGIQIGANTPGYHDASLLPISYFKAHMKENELQQQQQQQQQHINTMTTTTGNVAVGVYVTSATATRTIPIQPASDGQHVYKQTQQQMQDVASIQVLSSSSNSDSKTVNSVHLQTTAINNTTSTATTATTTITTTTPHKQSMASEGMVRNVKKIPYNFIHASNPNLVEFDFQTSKTLDYALPKINSNTSWNAHTSNTQGFMTLKDLMLQKQEEEAQDMYNNRVLLGIEKKEEKKCNNNKNNPDPNLLNSANAPSGGGVGDFKVAKAQNRSLPKPPDYEISFKPDDEDIQLTRTKEGLKLRDFGYELISGDDPVEDGGNGANVNAINSQTRLNSGQRPLQQSHQFHGACNMEQTEHNSSSNWAAAMKTRGFLLTSNKHKKSSVGSNSCSSASDLVTTNSTGEKRLGSFKKKGKLESFKTSSERIFQFGKQTSGATQNTTTSGITMTLPLNKKSHHGGNGSGSGGGGSGIKKSNTYNNDLKDKAGCKYEVQRKNSAPMPIFSKLSFATGSSSTPSTQPDTKVGGGKEKKLLGSPLLHRTVFGHHHHNHQQDSLQINHNFSGNTATTTSTGVHHHPLTYMGREYDQEIFSQVIFPKVTSSTRKYVANTQSIVHSNMITAPEMNAPPPPPLPQPSTQTQSQSQSQSQSLILPAAKIPHNANATESINMQSSPDSYSMSDNQTRRCNNNINNINNNNSEGNGKVHDTDYEKY